MANSEVSFKYFVDIPFTECHVSLLTSYKTPVSRQSYPSPPGLLSGSWHRGCAHAPRRKGSCRTSVKDIGHSPSPPWQSQPC